MRSIFLLGGFLGFSVALLGGFMGGRETPAVLRDAAIGCLLMAFVFRWFWSVLVKSFHETARAKRVAAEATALALEAVEAGPTPAGIPAATRPSAPALAGSAGSRR